jgi:integrase
MRLTDRGIAALKPKAARYEAWEDGRTGLGVRVSPAGRKSWVFMYRFGGRARRMGLGTYPAVSLADAKVKHAKAKADLEKGIDPGAKQTEQKQAERNAETVADLVEEYLVKWARPNKRSAAEDERILRKNVLPAWSALKARDITRRDVITLLDGIVERGSPIMANRTLAAIRKMFNFAISRDILDTTPAAMVKAPAKENRRDRVLSADEIRTLWKGLETAPMTEGAKLVLKLQLATAQRKGEIVSAVWEEFDFEENVWTIPAERAKNNQAHRVPLSTLALALIQQAREQASGSPTLFPSPWLFPSRTVDGPITALSINNALAKSLPKISLKDVTPHDLRRTAASSMTSLGINRLVVAKILNHVETGVTAVYDRHGYDAEKRHALDAWAARLEEIVTGEPAASNVVPLATAGDAQ